MSTQLITNTTTQENNIKLNNLLHFPNAAQPDIIRANQKDLYYQLSYENQLTELFRLFFGNRITSNYTKEIGVISDAIYFWFSTVLGNTTFGEEYCNIIQIDKNSFSLPSLSKRVSMVFCHVGIPYLITSGIPILKFKLRTLINSKKLSNPKLEVIIEKLANQFLPLIQKLIEEYLQPIHLAIFYFTGSYYHFSKRLFGLQYFYPRKLRPGEQRTGYEILGLLLSIQLIIKASSSLLKVWKNYQSDTINITKENDNEIKAQSINEKESNIPIKNNIHSYQKCTLCLSNRIDTTSTPCGHLFCYNCIGEWCRNKPECPLCRQPASLAQLWPVINF